MRLLPTTARSAAGLDPYRCRLLLNPGAASLMKTASAFDNGEQTPRFEREHASWLCGTLRRLAPANPEPPTPSAAGSCTDIPAPPKTLIQAPMRASP